MSIEVKVPQLPESVTDATLVSWHKKPGDKVARDENLVDLETDKVVLEVPAPSAGVLKEIKVENGTTVTAGQVLAILEAGEGTVEVKAAAAERRAPLRLAGAPGRRCSRWGPCTPVVAAARTWPADAGAKAASKRPSASGAPGCSLGAHFASVATVRRRT